LVVIPTVVLVRISVPTAEHVPAPTLDTREVELPVAGKAPIPMHLNGPTAAVEPA